MDLSPEKIFLVGVIALIVMGPERLPHAARTAGKVLAEVRRLSAGLQREVSTAMDGPKQAVDGVAGQSGLNEVRSALRDVPHSWRSALKELGQAPVPTTAPAAAAASVDLSVAPVLTAAPVATAVPFPSAPPGLSVGAGLTSASAMSTTPLLTGPTTQPEPQGLPDAVPTAG